MNQQKGNKTTSSKKVKNKSGLLRISDSLQSILDDELKELSKKKKGTKRIDQSELLRIGLMQLNDSHREYILSLTITGKDRRNVAYANYLKKHKKITKSRFIDLIQEREVEIDDYLPDEMKKVNFPTDCNNIGA